MNTKNKSFKENFQEAYHIGQFDALDIILRYCKCNTSTKERIIEFIETLIKREQQILRDLKEEDKK